jgi:NAD(P)-dependent dehydrogenase (short-subunit alcohol dehydrogenase family)
VSGISGKVAVVTGASRGLGQCIAGRLVEAGANVALLARDEKALKDTAEEIAQKGVRTLVVSVDLGNPQSIERMKRTVEGDLGAPSILINAAGIFGPIDLVRNGDPAAWIETIMVNAVGPYLTCRAFVGGMIDRGWGRIVNVSSAASLHEPGSLNSAYSTSKTALNRFTRHLAAELAGTGVTANVIHPGDVKTDMWAYIVAASEPLGTIADSFLQWGKWVEQTGGDDPEKAADLVIDLMSDEAATVNGQFLWIKDGLQDPIESWRQSNETRPWRRT